MYRKHMEIICEPTSAMLPCPKRILWIASFVLIFSSAITGLTAGFVNASTLNVSWDAVSPSEKVSGYDVIVLEGTTALRRIGVDNITSSIETSSLDQCRNYTVKVAANSTVGSGNYSTLDLVTKCGKSPGMAITSFFHELFKRLKIAVKTRRF